ncbi:chemotaxis-specific protein-glutamate methyltransferase CheB [Candidatus Margulisiibacteriota bacterium]
METAVIKVLIVEDSFLVAELLSEIINSDPELLVVGVARDGHQGVELAQKLNPDIITMDINMPVMDGFEATKQIMAYNPKPILIISSAFTGEVDKIFRAFSYGALDVVHKGAIEDVSKQESKETLELIISKLKFLSKVKVIRHPLAKLEKPRIKTAPASIQKGDNFHQEKIVGIVASTGGPRALLEVLRHFPPDFPCSVAIVQHISEGFTRGLVEWLGKEIHITIKEAEQGETLRPATAYVAPFGLQMQLTEDGKVLLEDGPPCNGFKPSANVLLKSVAAVYKEGAIGVILTGMGEDGAEGIKEIKQNGGATIAEDEKTAAVFGMPKAAIEMGVVDKVLPIDRIGSGVIEVL